jgi:hypothetical protein
MSTTDTHTEERAMLSLTDNYVVFTETPQGVTVIAKNVPYATAQVLARRYGALIRFAGREGAIAQ